MQVVANGDADVAHIVWQPLISAYVQGVRGKFIYQTFTKSSFFLAVEPDSPIKGPADLANKKIGLVNMASPGLFFAKSVAKAGGVNPETLQFVPVNVGAQPLAALESKQIDVLSFWDAVYADYEAMGKKLRYIDHPTIGQVGNGGFFAMDNVIKAKPAELQAFTRAIAKATVFILANPEASLKMYWAINPDGKLPGTEEEALKKGTEALKFVAHSWDITQASRCRNMARSTRRKSRPSSTSSITRARSRIRLRPKPSRPTSSSTAPTSSALPRNPGQGESLEVTSSEIMGGTGA